MKNNCWAIIPARGGSTGVKGKNIKILDNKPLIAHTIDTLKDSNIFEKIVVTSDCEDILSVAEKFGAQVHLRSDPNESDNFVMPDIPVLSFLESITKSELPMFCMMVQCTAPFVTAKSFCRALKVLQENPTSTAFAAHIAHSFLWERENESNSRSNWLPINHPFHERLGRQFSKTQQVNETGAFYAFPTKQFMYARHRFFSKAYPVIISGDEIVDINTGDDWIYADFLTKRRRNCY